jgi:hypothetical protein
MNSSLLIKLKEKTSLTDILKYVIFYVEWLFSTWNISDNLMMLDFLNLFLILKLMLESDIKNETFIWKVMMIILMKNIIRMIDSELFT